LWIEALAKITKTLRRGQKPLEILRRFPETLRRLISSDLRLNVYLFRFLETAHPLLKTTGGLLETVPRFPETRRA
jgi:hypothetical protein